MFANSAGTNQVYVTKGGACQVRITCQNVANGSIPANVQRTYTKCVIADAIEVNRGTKFSTFVISFTAHRDPATGKLWTEQGS